MRRRRSCSIPPITRNTRPSFRTSIWISSRADQRASRGGCRRQRGSLHPMQNFKRTALLLTVPASLVAIGLYAAPILQVLALSLTEPKLGLANYQNLFANAAVGRVVMTTLKVSVMTTVLTVLASYIVAFAIIHMSAGWRRISLFLVLVPF